MEIMSLFRPLRRFLTNVRTNQFEQLDTRLIPEVYGSANSTSPQKLLIREHGRIIRNITSSLMKVPSSNPPHPLLIINGYKGVGKTSILHQTVADARLRGMIVLYIPDAREWTHGSGFFAGVNVEGKDPLLEGVEAIRFYDRPEEIGKVFDNMITAHGDQLEGIKCNTKFSSDFTKDCSSLLELIHKGKEYLALGESDWRRSCEGAGDVFTRLMLELSNLPSDLGFMLVIDNYEWLVGLTAMQNDRRQYLHANAIKAVAEHFGRTAIEAYANNITKGLVLLATDPSHAFQEWRRTRVKSGVDYPLGDEILHDVSGKRWIRSLKDRVKMTGGLIEVDPMSNHELKAACSTFVKGGVRKLAERDGMYEEDRLVALAGGRADIMRRVAVSR